jgi:hypothetical protein
MGKGHLVLGEIQDFLSGKMLVETHDERARQQIARFLVKEKGYPKDEVASRISLPVTVDGRVGHTRIDFALRPSGMSYAVVIYGPGSLVTRQKPALAAASLMESYMVPYAVVTNGLDAEVLDTRTGKVVGTGLSGIPSRQKAMEEAERIRFAPVPEGRRDQARRILFAMDILSRRECDDACETCE